MAFKSAEHIAPALGGFEPQRTYNWSLEIALDDAGDQILIMQGLQTFQAPKESNEEIEVNFANEKRYVPGKAVFEALPLTLADFVDQGVAQAVVRWRRLCYNAESGSIGLARDLKKTADLVLYSPDQSSARFWKLFGCWPQSVEYGELDMTNSDFVKITVNIRYDRAVPGDGLNGGLGGLNVGFDSPPI